MRIAANMRKILGNNYLFAVLFSAGVCFSFIGQGGLSVDGIRYSAIAYRIQSTGDLTHLYDEFLDAPYANKPPWLFWATALSYRAFGYSTFASKLPGSIFAFLALCAFWKMLRRHYNERAAFLGIFALAGNPIFFRSVPDLTFEGLVVCACVCSLDVLISVARGQRPRWIVFGLGLVLFLISKPPFILFPLVSLVAIRRRDLRVLGSDREFWLKGILPIFVGASWYLCRDRTYLSVAAENQLLQPFRITEPYWRNLRSWGEGIVMFSPLPFLALFTLWLRKRALASGFPEDLLFELWVLPALGFVAVVAVRSPYLYPSAIAATIFTARILAEWSGVTLRSLERTAAVVGTGAFVFVGIGGFPVALKNPFVEALEHKETAMDSAVFCVDGKSEVDSRASRRRMRMTLELALHQQRKIYSSESLPLLLPGDLVLAEDQCTMNLMRTTMFEVVRHFDRASLLSVGAGGYSSRDPGNWDDTLTPEDH